MSILNNSLLLGQEGGGGYVIPRSLRFNSSDSAYLSRTPASAGNRKTWTLSLWLKRAKLGQTYEEIISNTDSSAVNGLYCGFTGDAFQVAQYTASFDWNLITTQVFRDTSSWGHLLVAADTTQSTASNRIKVYWNGVQITSFSTETYPTQNLDINFNTAVLHAIGRFGSNTTAAYYANMYMADIHFIDGQALTPSSFGEFDTNNVWQPKAYTGTYGTNGFHLDFADNSAATATALGKDTSGNGNNWTPVNLSVQPSTNDNWSGFFDGSGDGISFTSISVGTGSFTYEAWVRKGDASRFPTAIWDSTTGLHILGFASDSSVSNSQVLFGASSRPAGGNSWSVATAAVPLNSWAHVAYVRNGSTVTFYINGIASGSFTNSQTNGVARIGLSAAGGESFNGYISNARLVTSALYTSNFTPPSAPLSAVSGTQLLTLQSSTFVDNSGNGRSLTAIGNASVSGASPFEDSFGENDSLVDSPSSPAGQTDSGAGGTVVGNYATLNPLAKGGDIQAPTNGNLQVTSSGGGYGLILGTIGMSSGKWYWEVTTTSANCATGIATNQANLASYGGSDAYSWVWASYSGGSNKRNNNSGSSYGSILANGDIVGVAFDADNGTLTFYKNNTSQGAAYTGLAAGTYLPVLGDETTGSNIDLTANFGQRPFAYTAPSGFKALCTANLPTPTIANGATAMDVKLYTGNGSTQTISGLNFSPDFVWIKNRTRGTANHALYDVVRGRDPVLASNTTAAELTGASSTQDLTSFNSDGFSLGTVYNGDLNRSTEPYAAWCWDAGTSTVTNTQGSITSQVRANASAGFSVQTWTSSGTGTDSWGHGLGIAPEFVIVKRRNTAQDWYTWHKSITSSQYLLLNSTSAVQSYTNIWGSSGPSSSLVYFSASAGDHVSYAFAPVAGYSSAFSFTGNGSTDGPMVWLGFRPRLILYKCSSAAYNWFLVDTARDTYNVAGLDLLPNSSAAESDDRPSLDILSNGFKVRNFYASQNGSGATFVGFAWAENPFAYARAR